MKKRFLTVIEDHFYFIENYGVWEVTGKEYDREGNVEARIFEQKKTVHGKRRSLTLNVRKIHEMLHNGEMREATDAEIARFLLAGPDEVLENK